MSNTFITDARIAKESMTELHNQICFVKNINKQYSKEFGQSGAQIGNTINVKRPNRYAVQQGPTIVPQGTTESTVPLTLNRFWTIPLMVSDVERQLNINDFRKQCLTPAISKMAAQIDFECHYAAVNGVYPTANAAGSTACPGAGPINTVIGTPGTTPGTAGGAATALLQYNAPAFMLNAGMVLDNAACPRDGQRSMILNSAAHASSVGSLTGLFNPQGIISEQYKKGLLGNALDFDFFMDQNVSGYTSGTGVSLGTITLVDQTATAGATGTTSGGVFSPGTAFTVAGVYAVNPETQQSTGILQQFVVTETNTASTTTVTGLKISPTPKLVGAGIADGNVWTAGGTLTAQTATITSGTTASTQYVQNMAFHADAFTLGTADLPLPSQSGGGGIQYAAREVFDGISMRVVTFWDGLSSSQITRLDVLGGFSCLRPEFACRITG